MRFRSFTFTWKQVLSTLVGIIVFCSALWMTTGFVRAYWVLKTVHVFPTNVSSVGWDGAEKSLRQDLSPKAQFDSFGPDNSAYLVLAATTTSTLEPVTSATSTPVIQSEAPVFPPMMSNPEAQ